MQHPHAGHSSEISFTRNDAFHAGSYWRTHVFIRCQLPANTRQEIRLTWLLILWLQILSLRSWHCGIPCTEQPRCAVLCLDKIWGMLKMQISQISSHVVWFIRHSSQLPAPTSPWFLDMGLFVNTQWGKTLNDSKQVFSIFLNSKRIMHHLPYKITIALLILTTL